MMMVVIIHQSGAPKFVVRILHRCMLCVFRSSVLG